MDDRSSDSGPGIQGSHSLNTWTRVYLHGLLALVVLFAIAYAVSRIAPAFDFVGSRPLAIATAIVVILAGPPIIGSIILFGVFPLLGKKEAWRGLVAWDDRLISEVSDAREKAQVVIINWPSREVRTMGVLTATFDDDGSGRKLAAVYTPTAPQTKFGYVRVVDLEDVEFTDWTLKEWQLYQFTFGSAAPARVGMKRERP